MPPARRFRQPPAVAAPAGISYRGFRRILALGAHPDDIELGCGGSLVLASKAGLEVHAAIMSACEDEAPRGRSDLRSN